MRPSEIRERILHDHRGLRRRLDRLERLARDSLAGRPSQGALRREAEQLLDRLLVHMGWEDRYLVPVLRVADGFGAARCEQFAADHREQRELLDFVLTGLRDDKRPEALVAGNLLDLIALLRADMDDEEAVFLDERIVRDDAIASDPITG